MSLIVTWKSAMRYLLFVRSAGRSLTSAFKRFLTWQNSRTCQMSRSYAQDQMYVKNLASSHGCYFWRSWLTTSVTFTGHQGGWGKTGLGRRKSADHREVAEQHQIKTDRHGRLWLWHRRMRGPGFPWWAHRAACWTSRCGVWQAGVLELLSLLLTFANQERARWV